MIGLVLAAILSTAEQPVSVARQGVAARSFDFAPVSASNGKAMLIAWTDERGPQAVRIDASGARLDPNSIGLPIAADAVFWNDQHWVVLNEDHFARIDPEGNVIDRIPRVLDLDMKSGFVFGAVWTGAAAVVIAGDLDRHELTAWTYDAEMRRTATKRLGTFALDNFITPPIGIASTGSSALVLFNDGRSNDFYGAFFGRSGLFERTLLIYQPPTISKRAAIGTDGERYTVIVPADLANPAKWTGFTLHRDLTRTNLPVFTVADAVDQGPFVAPNLAFDGTVHTAYFTFLRDRRTRVSAVRIAPRGTVFDSVAAPVFHFPAHEGFTGAPHVQSAGATTAFVYGQRATGRFSFATVRIGSSADAIGAAPDLPLSTGKFAQSAPIAASGATQALVAWRENVAPGDLQTVYATRVDFRGKVADPQSIVLGRTGCVEAKLGAAGDGRDFLVAWHEATAVSASIVRFDGTTAPVRIAGTTGCPASPVTVASNGSMYLVVWHDRELFAARVTSNGTVLDSVPIRLGSSDSSARVASDGRDFLVAAGGEVFRITSSGVLAGGVMPLNGTAAQAWWNGRAFVVATLENDGGSFVCDARGCWFADAGAGGTLFLARVEDALRLEPVSGTFQPAGDGPPENVSLAAAGPTKFLAYERRVLDDGNATRVFLRPVFTDARRPAVRH